MVSPQLEVKAALAALADKYAAELARDDLRFFTVALRMNPRTGRPASYRADCTFEGDLPGRNSHDRDFDRPPAPSKAEAFSRSGARV